jgi:hypothetical protein
LLRVFGEHRGNSIQGDKKHGGNSIQGDKKHGGNSIQGHKKTSITDNKTCNQWTVQDIYTIYIFTYIFTHWCAAHIGMGGVKIKKEPCQRDEYVYRIS